MRTIYFLQKNCVDESSFSLKGSKKNSSFQDNRKLNNDIIYTGEWIMRGIYGIYNKQLWGD